MLTIQDDLRQQNRSDKLSLEALVLKGCRVICCVDLAFVADFAQMA